MPQPKKRLSATRSGNRRSHLHLEPQAVILCTHCTKPVLPHTACLHCGYYKNQLVLPKLAQK